MSDSAILKVRWGLTIRFGLLDEPDAESDILDNIELIADSDDPQLRASLVVGEERLELGTVEELLARAHGESET